MCRGNALYRNHRANVLSVYEESRSGREEVNKAAFQEQSCESWMDVKADLTNPFFGTGFFSAYASFNGDKIKVQILLKEVFK